LIGARKPLARIVLHGCAPLIWSRFIHWWSSPQRAPALSGAEAGTVESSIDISARLRRDILRILQRHSDSPLGSDEIGDDTLLIDGGLSLESIGLLNAIIEIEDAFQLRLREEDFQDGALTTVGGLVEHVRKKLGAPRSTG
jgi:acyl carrier protein